MADNNEKKPQVDPARALSAAHTPAQPKKDPKDRPKIEKIEGVTAKKVKTPLSTRIRQAFTNDSAQSVGDYLLFDVAIPALKATLFDLIQNGASRTLFGSAAPNRSPQRGSNINYNQISRQAYPSREPQQPQLSRSDRATHNFEGIIFPTRVGAERALTAMIETIEMYDVIAVSDLYEMVDITPSWSDDKWGWTDLRGADIQPVRSGFVLDLPAPQPIR